ncbi:MAG: redoxin domain-containing protein [Bdellovibrionota bacterium]
MHKKLNAGSTIPNFATNTVNGSYFEMKLVLNKKLLISFYRYASCPMCNQHFDDCMTRQGLFVENNVIHIAIFESGKNNFPKKITDQQFKNLVIIGDGEKRLYDLYGIENSILKAFHPQAYAGRAEAFVKGYRPGFADGSLTTVPAHFLVNPGGVIHTAHYGRHISDNIKWRAMEDFVMSDVGDETKTKIMG